MEKKPTRPILISSEYMDMHAMAVQYALQRKGVSSIRWCPADLPTKQSVSISYSNDDRCGSHIEVFGSAIDLHVSESSPLRAVWLRRRPNPVLPDDLHPGDRYIAECQCQALSEAFLPLLHHPDTFWVNHFSTYRTAACKPIQLAAARACGLLIPDTLISNEPSDIRQFIRGHSNRIAYKQLITGTWESNTSSSRRMWSNYTTTLSAGALPGDDVTRLTPSIFQELLEKAYELRVTCMGDQLVATRLYSQDHEAAVTDWRAGQDHIRIEPDELPDELADRTRALMRRLEIAFGCMDFVVTKDGRYIFLEVNPQGQFLWIEETTGIPLLDMFAEFIIASQRAFSWQPDHEVVRLSEYASGWREASAEEKALHVEPKDSCLIVAE